MTACCSSNRGISERQTDQAPALSSLPIAVIGGGPVGLAAAAHLLERGLEPVVFEAGPSVGTAPRDWGHVHMFSPWRYNVDRACRALLERHGWTAPDAERLPDRSGPRQPIPRPSCGHPGDCRRACGLARGSPASPVSARARCATSDASSSHSRCASGRRKDWRTVCWRGPSSLRRAPGDIQPGRRLWVCLPSARRLPSTGSATACLTSLAPIAGATQASESWWSAPATPPSARLSTSPRLLARRRHRRPLGGSEHRPDAGLRWWRRRPVAGARRPGPAAQSPCRGWPDQVASAFRGRRNPARHGRLARRA